MPGPKAWRSCPLAVAVVALQVSLTGCHKAAGESGDAQAPAQAGSPIQAGSPGEVGSQAQGPRSIRLVRSGGVGFDDLVYSSESHSVLAPAGATGCVDMFDS